MVQVKPRINIWDTYRSRWWPAAGEATLPRPQATGDQPGLLTSKRASSKRGDITIAVFAPPAYPMMVIEAMNRSGGTAKAIREELAEAMENRGAIDSIAATAVADHGLLCGQPIKPIGPNMWMTVLDPGVPDPCALQMAYLATKTPRVENWSTRASTPPCSASSA